jgi:hypothetical protein
LVKDATLSGNNICVEVVGAAARVAIGLVFFAQCIVAMRVKNGGELISLTGNSAVNNVRNGSPTVTQSTF